MKVDDLSLCNDGLMRRSHSLIAALILLGACTPPATPFPVLGERGPLAGEWEGSFQSPQTGRSGTILFHFGAGSDSASGTVLMTPFRDSNPSAVVDVGTSRAMSRALRITYVWCGGSEVTGRLDPYDDPRTGERIYTMFEGKMTGDTLTGSFSTLYPDRGRLLEGTWSVRRRVP